MTHCMGTLTDRCLERYIQGTLPETEAQEFEEHYFDCPECLVQVEALQAVALKLASEPRKTVRTPIPWPVRFSALGAIAATLAVGYLGFKGLHHSAGPAVASNPAASAPKTGSNPPPAPSLASSAASRLADLAMPAFQAHNLRGQSADLQFEVGMKAYTNQDCLGAVKALSQVPAQDEDALAAKFYTGACLMHEGDLGGASKTLTAVAEAGDSPQQEAALYLLAQVALARNDSAKARHYLARTVSLHGDFEKRARAEMIKLR